MTSHIYSKNGWDPLKEVIVGRANNANIPPYDASMQNFMYANLDPVAIKEFSGPYSEQVINEDLASLYTDLSWWITVNP